MGWRVNGIMRVLKDGEWHHLGGCYQHTAVKLAQAGVLEKKKENGKVVYRLREVAG